MVICEHRPELAGLAAAWLAQAGCELAGRAANARQAIEACLHQTPDVVLVDDELPAPAGMDILAALRLAAPGARIVAWNYHDTWTAVAAAADEIVDKDDFVGLERLADAARHRSEEP